MLGMGITKMIVRLCPKCGKEMDVKDEYVCWKCDEGSIA